MWMAPLGRSWRMAAEHALAPQPACPLPPSLRSSGGQCGPEHSPSHASLTWRCCTRLELMLRPPQDPVGTESCPSSSHPVFRSRSFGDRWWMIPNEAPEAKQKQPLGFDGDSLLTFHAPICNSNWKITRCLRRRSVRF